MIDNNNITDTSFKKDAKPNATVSSFKRSGSSAKFNTSTNKIANTQQKVMADSKIALTGPQMLQQPNRKQGSKPHGKRSDGQNLGGRDEKVDSDKYYKLMEENQKLKNEQSSMNEKFKELQTQIYSVGEKLLKERVHGDKKVIYLEEGSEIEMMNLKNENERLKEQLRKTKTVIKGMSTRDRLTNVTGQKNLMHAKSQMEATQNHNEYLALIKQLKHALNEKDDVIKGLHAELYGPNRKVANIEQYSKDIRDKNIQVSEVQLKCEQLQLDIETNKKIIAHLDESTKNSQIQNREDQKKIYDLKTENANLKANLERLPEYVSKIEEYRKKEIEFEKTINGLCESPFIKQAEERGNIYRKLQESEAALREQSIDLKKVKEALKDAENTLALIKKENETLKKEKDQYKEDAMRLKITGEEREKNTKNFQDQLHLLSQYGEVDSNFTKILAMLKLKDDDTSWMKVEFFDRFGEKNLKDPQFLIKELEKLIQEKGELGRQLEVTKNVLILQQKISEDLQKEKIELEKITTFQINELQSKCEKLARRTDIERRPARGHEKKDSYFGSGPMVENREDGIIADDHITEFTTDDNESVLGINENALDLYLGEGVFEEGIAGEVGIKLTELMTFASVDFYMHEIQTSNISTGKRPWYNLQLKYLVSEDEHLIKYIDSNEGITIEIYYLKDNMHNLLGYGKIPLSELLDSEIGVSSNNNSRVVNSVCSIFYKKDENLLIGHVHYKMRMRQSMLESLKWFREKMRLINEVSPMQNLVSNTAATNFNVVQGLNKGKVMQITIMLTQLVNLKTTGSPHEIRPYVWYQFFKNEEHFTRTFEGHSPVLEDIKVFNSLYDSEFDDYIQNGELAFMVLDDFRALEVKVNSKTGKQDEANQVDLVDSPDVEDFIGICRISLKDLILCDRIQGSFHIHNREGKIAGDLSLLIFWEEVILTNKNRLKNNVPYEKNAWEEDLIIKLGEKLRMKKLNVDSAFEFFNVDNQEILSSSNFRHVLLSQLKYMNSGEVDVIIDLLFGSSQFLSKLNFLKVFIPLLDNNVKQTQQSSLPQARAPQQATSEKQLNVTVTHVKDKQNLELVEEKANNMSIASKTVPVATPKDKLKTDMIVNTQPDDLNLDYKAKEKPAELEKKGSVAAMAKSTNDGFDFKNTTTNRLNEEIMVMVSEYVKRTNKTSISEIFKLFDKDTNSFINKKEVLNGFFRVNIPLSRIELDRIWAEMIENKLNTEKVDLALFKRFFENYGILKRVSFK